MASQDLTFGTETWTVNTPDDVTVSQVAGVLKIEIKYDENSFFNGLAHGIDAITFTPKVNDKLDLNGLKTPVEFDITNALPVPIAGFTINTFNNTTPTMPDTGEFHPNNYAHLHSVTAVGGTGAPFAPETVSYLLQDFLPAPSTVTPSGLTATGTLAHGATVSAMVATMHNAEQANVDNTFGIEFFVAGAPPTTAPTITGLPPTEDGTSGTIKPFSTVTVTDTNILPVETTIITVKDSNGALSDAVGPLTGTGVTHTGVGTYSLPAAFPSDLTTALHDVSFGVTANATVTLSVDNDTQNAPPPATASTNVTVPPPQPPNPPQPPGNPNPPNPPQNPPQPPGNPNPNPNPNPGSPSNPPDPNAHFHVDNLTTGQIFDTAGQPYTGPVSGIDWEYINITSDKLNVTALTPNVFIHSGSADDGLSVRNTGGTNILDGYTKSNFLDGGKSGQDTFYVDDRAPLSDIWSTVNNFHSGDNATIWGLTQQDFAINWADGQGATGFMGLTFHATNPGKPEASLTLAGYTSDDLNNGKLSVSFGRSPDTPGLPGTNYMLIHAN